jgi:hypothetical protein
MTIAQKIKHIFLSPWGEEKGEGVGLMMNTLTPALSRQREGDK